MVRLKMKRTRLHQVGLWLSIVALGCAGAGPAPEPATAQARGDVRARSDSLQKQLIPPGFGTLRQDEFTMQLRIDQLLIKVTPLAETVIRTGAPDTYNRLHALAESRRAEATRVASTTQTVELFLVSMFSYQPNVSYQPENVQLTHQGRQLRAVAILPLTPGWGRQQLQQQEEQRAIYAFASNIDYEQGITLRYNLDQNDEWGRIVSKLEVERAKIRARAESK
jgi:hypothetical protein